MALKEKADLKNYFRQGDIPTQQNYTNLIDSLMSITGSTIGNIDLTGQITSSGAISASGTGSFPHIQIPGGGKIQFDNTVGSNDQFIQADDSYMNIHGDQEITLNATTHTKIPTGKLFVVEHITASNLMVSTNITASGTVSASNFEGSFTGSLLTTHLDVQGQITASGNISSSGTIYGFSIDAERDMIVGTQDRFNSHGVGSKLTIERYGSAYPEAHIFCGADDSTAETGFQVVTRKSGGTVEGAFEIRGSDRRALFAGAVEGQAATFTTVNTGQGATEVHLMNQNIQTSDTPGFTGLYIDKDQKPTGGSYGSEVETGSGRAIKFTIIGIPNIGGRDGGKSIKAVPTLILNTSVSATDVVLINCTTHQLTATAFGMGQATDHGSPGFYISLANELSEEFTATSASFSAVIL